MLWDSWVSLEIIESSPFVRAHTSSYLPSIVTVSISLHCLWYIWHELLWLLVLNCRF